MKSKRVTWKSVQGVVSAADVPKRNDSPTRQTDGSYGPIPPPTYEPRHQYGVKRSMTRERRREALMLEQTAIWHVQSKFENDCGCETVFDALVHLHLMDS